MKLFEDRLYLKKNKKTVINLRISEFSSREATNPESFHSILKIINEHRSERTSFRMKRL